MKKIYLEPEMELIELETSGFLASSTGDVDLIDSDSDTFDIETSTGHVKGTILTTKIFDAKSDTGKVDVPLSGTGGLCKIRTSTGSIEIKIKE